MEGDINKVNQEIAELRKQLRENPLTPFDSKDLEKALLTVKALRNEFRESSSDLDYIAKSFKDTVNEMSKQNIFYNSAKKSINSIAAISRQLVDYRRGETSLSEKQLKNIQNQARVKFEDIKLAIDSGQLEKDDLIAAQKALGVKGLFNDSLEQTVRIQQQVNKEVGLLGEGLEGASKFLEKMGFAGIAKPISDAIQKTKDARIQILLINDAIAKGKEEYEKNEKAILRLSGPTKLLSESQQTRLKYLTDENVKLKENEKSLSLQNKELDKQTSKYKNIASSIKEQFTLTNMTDALLGKMVKSVFELNKAQTEFRRLTGESVKLSSQLNSKYITTIDYIKTAVSLTEELGLNAQTIFPPDTLSTAAEMVKTMGVTQEQANKAAIFSKLYGKNLEDVNKTLIKNVNTFNGNNKVALAHNKILKEVYSTSAATAVSLGKHPERLQQAVMQAQKLGLTLKDVEDIASSLLDIESSIAAEFEAEVITGRQLNLEAARYYALTNQTDKLTEEIAKNQGVISSFATDNRIEQEAIAKAFGLSRDQLANMYVLQQISDGLTAEEIKNNTKMELSDIKRLTLQESINTSIDKMVQLLAGPVEYILSAITNNAFVFYGTLVAIGALISTVIVANLIKTATSIAANLAIWKLTNKEKEKSIALSLRELIISKKMAIARAWSAAMSGPKSLLTGGLAGLAIGAILTAAILGAFSKAGDVFSPSDGKTRISTKEGGLFELSKNDDLVAAPGLVDQLNTQTQPLLVNQPTLQPQPQQIPQIDYDKMAQAMSRVQVQTNLDGVRVSSELQKAPLGLATRKI